MNCAGCGAPIEHGRASCPYCAADYSSAPAPVAEPPAPGPPGDEAGASWSLLLGCLGFLLLVGLALTVLKARLFPH